MLKNEYSIDDFMTPGANYFNLRGFRGEGIRIICNENTRAAGSGVIRVEFCIDATPFHEGDEFTLPITMDNTVNVHEGKVIARVCAGGRPLVSVLDKNIYFDFDPIMLLKSMLNEEYFERRRPLISRIPFDYHFVPGRARLAAHRLLAKKNRSGDSGFPAWPVESAAESLRALVKRSLMEAGAKSDAKCATFWPGGKKFALTLSHDLDTGKSFGPASEMAVVEKGYGLRSCWNIVGSLSHKFEPLINKLLSEGHEIGLHGDVHDNKIGYEGRHRIGTRLDSCRKFIDRCHIKGFRAPSLLTSAELDQAVAERFLWSSSTIDTDANTILAARRGVCSEFPFFKGALLEIPLTIPLDDRLLAMGIGRDEFVELVMNKIEWISRMKGMVFLGNHPEPHISGNRRMMSVYEYIISGIVRRNDAWIALPSEIAVFWKKLHGME